MEHTTDSLKQVSRKHGWRGTLIQTALLFGLWMILSGRTDAFHVGAGVLAVAIVLLLNRRLTDTAFFPGDESEWEHLRFDQLLRFLPWFAWAIVQGSLQVASVVLHPKLPVAPVVLRFRVKFPRVGARVMLGNTITLTPGTVTIGIHDDRLTVHALTKRSTASLVDCSMPRWIAKLVGMEEEELVADVEFIESREEL